MPKLSISSIKKLAERIRGKPIKEVQQQAPNKLFQVLSQLKNSNLNTEERKRLYNAIINNIPWNASNYPLSTSISEAIHYPGLTAEMKAQVAQMIYSVLSEQISTQPDVSLTKEPLMQKIKNEFPQADSPLSLQTDFDEAASKQENKFMLTVLVTELASKPYKESFTDNTKDKYVLDLLRAIFVDLANKRDPSEKINELNKTLTVPQKTVMNNIVNLLIKASPLDDSKKHELSSMIVQTNLPFQTSKITTRKEPQARPQTQYEPLSTDQASQPSEYGILSGLTSTEQLTDTDIPLLNPKELELKRLELAIQEEELKRLKDAMAETVSEPLPDPSALLKMLVESPQDAIQFLKDLPQQAVDLLKDVNKFDLHDHLYAIYTSDNKALIKAMQDTSALRDILKEFFDLIKRNPYLKDEFMEKADKNKDVIDYKLGAPRPLTTPPQHRAPIIGSQREMQQRQSQTTTSAQTSDPQQALDAIPKNKNKGNSTLR